MAIISAQEMPKVTVTIDPDLKDSFRRSEIMLEKIKASGSDQFLEYVRPLPSGKEEECKLSIKPAPADLEIAMLGLLPFCIDIIGLDENRWSTGKVTGITFKYPEPLQIGFTATLQNEEMGDDNNKIVISVTTPYIPSDAYARDVREVLKQIQQEAIAIIESQPEQTNLFAEG